MPVLLTGRLTLTIHGAHRLTNKTLLSTMDPFVKIYTSNSDEKFKTRVHTDGGQTPVWNQTFVFNLQGVEDLFHINVFHETTFGGNDEIGRFDGPWEKLIYDNQKHTYELSDPNSFTKSAGTIDLSVSFQGAGLPANLLPVSNVVAQQKPIQAQPQQQYAQVPVQYPAQHQYPAQRPQQVQPQFTQYAAPQAFVAQAHPQYAQQYQQYPPQQFAQPQQFQQQQQYQPQQQYTQPQQYAQPQQYNPNPQYTMQPNANYGPPR